MIEYFRVAVIAGAAWVYMGLMAAKFFQIQSCTSCCLDYLEGTEERITLLRLQNARLYSARNDLVRLLADFLILIGVAATGAFPAWFSLFPDSIPGFALGFAVLIFFSLTLSIVVDWVMASRYIPLFASGSASILPFRLSVSLSGGASAQAWPLRSPPPR